MVTHGVSVDGSLYESERNAGLKSRAGVPWGSVLVEGSSFAVQCPTTREALSLVFADVAELAAQHLSRAHAVAPRRLAQLAARRLARRASGMLPPMQASMSMGDALGHFVATQGGHAGSSAAAARVGGAGQASSGAPDPLLLRAPSDALLSQPLGLVKRLVGERERVAKTILASQGGRVLRSSMPFGWAAAAQGVPTPVFWRQTSLLEQVAVERRLLAGYGMEGAGEQGAGARSTSLVTLGLSSSVLATVWGSQAPAESILPSIVDRAMTVGQYTGVAASEASVGQHGGAGGLLLPRFVALAAMPAVERAAAHCTSLMATHPSDGVGAPGADALVTRPLRRTDSQTTMSDSVRTGTAPGTVTRAPSVKGGQGSVVGPGRNRRQATATGAASDEQLLKRLVLSSAPPTAVGVTMDRTTAVDSQRAQRRAREVGLVEGLFRAFRTTGSGA